jgi:hypothetical protein
MAIDHRNGILVKTVLDPEGEHRRPMQHGASPHCVDKRLGIPLGRGSGLSGEPDHAFYMFILVGHLDRKHIRVIFEAIRRLRFFLPIANPKSQIANPRPQNRSIPAGAH